MPQIKAASLWKRLITYLRCMWSKRMYLSLQLSYNRIYLGAIRRAGEVSGRVLEAEPGRTGRNGKHVHVFARQLSVRLCLIATIRWPWSVLLNGRWFLYFGVFFRPPSSQGRGIPTTANMYNANPYASKHRDFFKVRSNSKTWLIVFFMMPVNKQVSRETGEFKQCKRATAEFDVFRFGLFVFRPMFILLWL